MKTQQLDEFTQAYITCALSPLDDNYSAEDIAPVPLLRIIADCAEFQASCADTLAKAGSVSQNGHDFFLTRNRHSAGYWGRDYSEEVSAFLTEQAQERGQQDFYVGGDGQIYVQ